MSTFDTSDMAATLPEDAKATTKGTDRLTEQQLREAGWAEKQAYNYDSAMAKPSEGAAPGPAIEAAGDDGPGWAHNAARYEWSEDYGDVGPKIRELEEQLFKSEFLNRRGVKFDK